MADVTISSLPQGTPTANAVIPFSQNNTTYRSLLSSINDPYKVAFSVFERQTGQQISTTTALTFSNTEYVYNCTSPVSNNNKFLVPITGLYFFSAYVLQYLVSRTDAWTWTYCWVRKNNEDVGNIRHNFGNMAGTGTGNYNTAYSNRNLGHDCQKFCNAGDQVDVAVQCLGSGGVTSTSYIDNVRYWNCHLIYPL